MKSRFTFLAINISLLFFFYGVGLCQDKASGSDWVDKVGRGNINWSAGYVEAIGFGSLPDYVIKKINARPVVLREAKADALRNLMDIIKSVQFDSATAIKDFTLGGDIVDRQICGLVKDAEVADYQYMPDGRAEVKMRISLYGNLTRIVMPLAMAKSSSVPTPTESVTVPAVKASESPSAPLVYTGMVVDARGIQARPAISPRIFNEDGKEFYGLANIDREYAEKKGICEYVRDPTAAKINQRVGANPIKVKAVRTSGPGKSDIIISNSDAQKVRTSAETAIIFKQCKVVIVLD